MQRRELLAMTVGGLLASALRAGSHGQAPSAPTAVEDEGAARRHDRERRFVETRCGRIAHIDRGTGRVALFLHGFPLSSFQWRGAIERLSAQRRCVAPDFLGLGHTEVASGQSVTPSAQVDMVTALLDRLGIEQADLVANDSGGAVAQLFLSQHPERVRTLLLTNCDVEIESPPAAVLPIIEWARAGLYADLYLEPWVNHKDEARSADGLGGMCYSDPAHPSDAALEQYLRPLVASPERKALLNRYAVGLAPNPLQGLAPVLRTCTVPTRIIWGTGDTIFSAGNADYLASVLPRVVGVRRVSQAKLFFPEEYPDLIAEEARALWRG